jgi:cell wall-associated NlpC family hydrolase
MRHKLLFLLCIVIGLAPLGASAMSDGASTVRDAPLIYALRALGVRYRYGGESFATGFDCSGLVTYVFEHAWGLLLPHSSKAQSELGTPVGLSELEPGDLLFYNTRKRAYSHVGIYLGDGSFIHAPRSGQRVRVESVHSSYWRARFNGARRLEPPV